MRPLQAGGPRTRRPRAGKALAAVLASVAASWLPGPAARPPVRCFVGVARKACRAAVAGRRSAENPRFSAEKLRAESDDPFSKVRLFFFGFGLISALTGFLFTLPRLIGSLFGAPKAAPLGTVGTDLAIDLGCAVVLGFLTKLELDVSGKREQQREEGALIARLPVLLQGQAGPSLVKLSDLRSARKLRSRRPVLCMGGPDFCRSCIEASARVAAAVDVADLLLVPVLSNDTPGDSAMLAEASKGLAHVAFPGAEAGLWDEFRSRQAEQVLGQGLDESDGMVVIVKKNGRVAMRFVGAPNWEQITSEVAARESRGLDTTNI